MNTKTLILAAILWLTFTSGRSFAASTADATQSVSGGGVTVTITYVNPKTDENPRFQVALNTHTVALDSYDLKTLAVLRDGTGKTYAPTEVENKGGGHHRQVILTFPKPPPDSKRVEVVIKNVGGVEKRTFRWDRQ